MKWQYLEIDEIYLIHEVIIKRAGTKASVRDFSLLHSSAERAKATFAGKDLYPTVFAKAAAYMHSICLNHPFTDGNKRTSFAVAHKFLWNNGFHLKVNKAEAVRFMTSLDDERFEIKGIVTWLQKHSSKIE